MATPEERTGSYYASALFSTIATFAEVLGWEKALDIYLAGVRRRSAMATSMLLERLKITERDASVFAPIMKTISSIIMPGLRIETPEVAPKLTVLRFEGTCILWEAARKMGLQEKIHVGKVCDAFGGAMGETVNPKITVTATKKICKGDTYCEYIMELKE
jgi:hypothetical protein